MLIYVIYVKVSFIEYVIEYFIFDVDSLWERTCPFTEEGTIKCNLSMVPLFFNIKRTLLTSGTGVKELLGLSKEPKYIWNYNEYVKNSYKVDKVAGTYAIYNPFSKKVYVGSSGNLKYRLNIHFNKPLYSNKPLQNAFIKYGKYNLGGYAAGGILIFDTIINPPYNSKELRVILKPLEDYFLDYISKDKLYNIQLKAYSSTHVKPEYKLKLKTSKLGSLNPFYGKTHTAATRLKISLTKMGTPSPLKGIPRDLALRLKMSLARLGKSLDLATRLKISKALMGRTFSEAHRKKISESSMGKTISMSTRLKLSDIVKANPPTAKAIKLTNIHTQEVFNFPTIVSAAQFVNGHRNSMSNALKTNRVYKNKWLVSHNS